MTYVIAQPCVDVKDKACIEECPVDCIYEGARMLYIHPDECVDCGACEPVCPVEAIFYEDDVPDQWSSYTQNNADFFEELGSPGGSQSMISRPPASPADCSSSVPDTRIEKPNASRPSSGEPSMASASGKLQRSPMPC